MRTMTLAGLFLFATALVPARAPAGDLNPPPGPIQPTDRVTINPAGQPLPIIIDEPGSYVLTGPILDCIGCEDLPTSGLVISASDVTVDLNGFQIVGDPVNSIHGIEATAGFSNIVIRNGTVRDWGSDGVLATSAITLESLRVHNCGHLDLAQGGVGGDGMELGQGARVVDCEVFNCAGDGVAVGFGSLVRGCTVGGNQGHGVHALFGAISTGCVIDACVARQNSLVGFNLGDGTVARGCAASQNGGDGFVLAPGSSASNCTAAVNGGAGFNASGSLVHACAAVSNTGGQIALSNGATSADSHP